MNIKDLQKNWDTFGKTNPYWAILTSKKKWDTAEFFKTGESEIDGIMRIVTTLGLQPRRGRALDFGCGAGRLTQALCKHFDQACGIDIAPSMISLANQHNKFKDRCRYYLNDREDLTLFESNHFDFIYCTIVLQHMRPEYSKSYIKEFLRILAPGGVLVFQIPSHKPSDEVAPALAAESAATASAATLRYSLPSSAFRAKIDIVSMPSSIPVGGQATVVARVKNMGDVVWPAYTETGTQSPVNLGNHWLNDHGQVVVSDDARANLPYDLPPQAAVELPLTVTAPIEPAASVLELDMVQEWVTWFKDKGSETAKAPIKVIPPKSSVVSKLSRGLSLALDTFKSTTKPDKFEPVMEMYGVPKPEVIALVESQGGTIVHIQDNDAAAEMVGFRYYVVK